MKKYYCVYQIEHIKTGKIYIGIHETHNLNDDYMGSGKYILRAVEKHGKDAFKKTIMHIYSNHEDMLNKEKELVTEDFCNRKDTYNIAPGGFGGGWKYANKKYWTKDRRLNHNRKHSGFKNLTHEQQSEYGKLGYIALVEKHSHKIKEWASKGGKSSKGSTLTEEHKRKIGEKNSINQSGVNNSQYGTMWITNGNENRKIKKIDIIPEGWYKGRK